LGKFSRPIGPRTVRKIGYPFLSGLNQRRADSEERKLCERQLSESPGLLDFPLAFGKFQIRQFPASLHPTISVMAGDIFDHFYRPIAIIGHCHLKSSIRQGIR